MLLILNCKSFFADYISKTGKTTTIDLTGNIKELCNIKMVTTPSSLKLFKFIPVFFENKKDCLNFWIENTSNVFGVCKSEKPSFFDGAIPLSYQMINSMPFTKSDIDELMKYEVDYIDKLNNNYAVFKHHIGLGTPNTSREFIYNMMCVNEDVQYTKMYKEFRRHTVDHYKEKLKNGKILIPNSDYSILLGNPYEMLLTAVGEEIEDTVHHSKEIYCKRYGDQKELICFRNPHICAGNVLIAKNVYNSKFEWFNLSSNIVIINSYDNDIYDRLQGCDLDSDSCLISDLPVLFRVGKECLRFKTPINKIKTEKTHYVYNQKSHSDIDNAIADNFIGRIINLSQMLNSYYWDIAYKFENEKEWYDFETNKTILQNIYDKISLLSSLSQLELDKAKKFFEFGKNNNGDDITMFDKIENIIKHDYGEKLFYKKKVDVINDSPIQEQAISIENLLNEKKECQDSDKIKELNKQIKNITTKKKIKMVKPMFFEFNSQDTECYFRMYKTPMDFVCNAVDNIPKALPIYITDDKGKRKRIKEKPIDELLIDFIEGENNRHQIQSLVNICAKLQISKNAIYKKGLSNDERKKKKEEYDSQKLEAIDKISKLTIWPVTMGNIFKRCYSPKRKGKQNDDIKQYKLMLLQLINKAKPDLLPQCFYKNGSSYYTKLIKDFKGNIDIFGNKYKEVAVFKQKCVVKTDKETT